MRKLIEFDAETYDALVLLSRDRMNSLQELADEAFTDLLKKHGRPTSLKDALRKSLAAEPRRTNAAKGAKKAPRKSSTRPSRDAAARPS
ncbi:MAG: hypothetical protein AB7E79_08795 [Rhodospirillaceae bacterium]